MYNTALHASKEVKNKTKLSSGTTTVSYATVQYIQSCEAEFPKPKVLVYGLGKIGKSTVKGLSNHIDFNELTVINRTPEKARKLQKELGVRAQEAKLLEDELKKADVVVVATGSNKPTVTKEMLNLKKKQLIIDLSIPNNVETEIGTLNNKVLVNVDQLSSITKSTLESRKEQVPKVEKIIEKYKNEFYQWVIFRKSTPALNALKNTLETIQKDAITANLKKHESLNTVEVEEITSFMINKIVSRFAAHLREDNGKADASIEVIEKVFG